MVTSKRAKDPVLIKIIKSLGVFILCCLTLSIFIGCKKEDKIILEKLLRTEPSVPGDAEGDNERIEELSKDIEILSAEVSRTVKAVEKLGTYYRLLALEYFDRDMYGPALENFRKALGIYPVNYQLHYYAGVCSSLLAKTEARQKERAELFAEAEQHYLQALRLKPGYADVLFALSVLYVFELDIPLAAEPLLETLLSQEPNHIQGLFLSARLKVLTGRIEEAAELYDRIIEESKDRSEQNTARENKQALLEGTYAR